MKVSKYNITINNDKEYTIFSTLSKCVVSLVKDKYKDLINNCSSENYELLNEKEIKFLYDNYFIINDDINENQISEYLMNKDRLDQKVFSSYIAFSTICNFACVYCYEEGQVERKFIMNDEIINLTIDWYYSRIVENNYKECLITLYGGEPLVHKDIIKNFFARLYDKIKSTGCLLKVSMITNGYLLDNDIIEFLSKYNLKEIQITIDGVGKTHNERRPLRSGGETFDIIIKNVENSIKFDGRFLFRVSFDESNIEEVKKTIDYLSNLKTMNKFAIYLALIHQTSNQINDHCSFCSNNVLCHSNKILKTYKELIHYMNTKGLPIPTYYSNGPCMTVSNDTVLIDPYGDIYKCVEMIGINELCVGNVKDLTYNHNVYKFISKPNYEKCIEKDCKYVTLCGGGCLMKTYLENNNLSSIDCQKEYYEELIPFLLEEKYGK